MLSTETCPYCNAALGWSSDSCPGCGRFVGAPNVREAAAEAPALIKRYQDALANRDTAEQRVARRFHSEIETRSQAVVNVHPEFLSTLLCNDKQLYAGYALQVAAEIRTPAERQGDRQRCGVEGILFGSFANQIRYAALTLDERGLRSYGECSFTIKPDFCTERASLLERNSYYFVRQHKLLPGDSIPPAMRSDWKHRAYLASAKLLDAGELKIKTQVSEFPCLLLKGMNDRHLDEFVEVHIYGAVGWQAFSGVTLPARKLSRDTASSVKRIQDLCHAKGIRCQKKN